MKIHFLGATGTVTGSRFLVESGDRRVLVDCGMFQGLKELRERNWGPLPVPPESIDAVVLTHAHIDHSGWLPVLTRDGFTGDVWCTPLTASLAEILLRDAAYLQEEDARHRNKHGTTRHQPALPLYTSEDAEHAISRLRTHGYGTSFEVADGMRVTFNRAGHILGAATVHIADDEGRSVAFTGDVGRNDDPVMLPPEPLPAADHVVTESTYGDRRHPDVDLAEELAAVVNRTVDRGGAVLVPSFAVGRAQALLHMLSVLRRRGDIPRVPIHLNSPMAIDVTELLVDSIGEHRLDEAECRAIGTDVNFTRTVEESKDLTVRRDPHIVVTASGMVTGGRVLHHLVQLAPDPRNTILFPGYQAQGTRGRSIVDGAGEVKVFGSYVPINAEVCVIDGFSAHADARELSAWLARTPEPATCHIVHGEPTASDALRRRLRDDLGWRTHIPRNREVVEVMPRP